MNALVIGSGGREHALAWSLAASRGVDRVFVAPGNGGTGAAVQGKSAAGSHPPICSVELAGPSHPRPEALVGFALAEQIGLTVVGPEVPLAAGIVDLFQAAGLHCFGPTRAAAQLEASKVHAKAFMVRHGIPTARWAAFRAYEDALAHLHRVDYPVVVKASGLAAGKGVIVPDDTLAAEAALREIMVERAFGDAGDEVLIEERLTGPEVSLLAFSDGVRVAPMPAAQDHKRVADGDRGPNTGGMGAYAPAPILTPELQSEIMRLVLEPTIAGMRAEGRPYVGALYAGLMLTPNGPRGLEFNCRFGDPETQVILPLLESDLAAVCLACLDGSLDPGALRWRQGAAATVVAASAGYPGHYPKGRPIDGVERAEALPGVLVFHAGTRRAAGGILLTDGGRVLAVTGVASDLPAALSRAYSGLAEIHFEGMQFRHDIGAGASQEWQKREPNRA